MPTIIELPLSVQIKLGLESGPDNRYVPLAEYLMLEALFQHSAQQYTQADEERGELLAKYKTMSRDFTQSNQRWNKIAEDTQGYWQSTIERNKKLHQLLIESLTALKSGQWWAMNEDYKIITEMIEKIERGNYD